MRPREVAQKPVSNGNAGRGSPCFERLGSEEPIGASGGEVTGNGEEARGAKVVARAKLGGWMPLTSYGND